MSWSTLKSCTMFFLVADKASKAYNSDTPISDRPLKHYLGLELLLY